VKQFLALLNARNLRIGVILVPWVLAALYLIVFASDRYVVESIVAVRQNGGESSIGINLNSLLGSSVGSTQEDEQLLRAHVLSMDMLRKLDEELDLRTAFSAPRADFVFRLAADATQEEFLAYYRKRVDVEVDHDSGLVSIRTQAFTPELAEALNRGILKISEQFINESSHRLAREQMSFAQSELEKARGDVTKARDRLLAFQNEHGILDPMAQVAGASGLTVQLQAQLARQEAELKGLLSYLNENAPQVQTLRAAIAGTRAQLEAESRRGISVSGADNGLNVLAGNYQQLLGELEFAQDAYKLALAGVESARVEATRKLKSLILVDSPRLPEAAQYPRRAYTLFALFVALGLLYGIVRLIVATIEDHLE